MGIRQFILRQQFVSRFGKRQHTVQCARRMALFVPLFALVSLGEFALKNHFFGWMFGLVALVYACLAAAKHRLASKPRL